MKSFHLAREIVLVPVLRAGLGMIEVFLNFSPEARVGHVGVYRNVRRSREPMNLIFSNKEVYYVLIAPSVNKKRGLFNADQH